MKPSADETSARDRAKDTREADEEADEETARRKEAPSLFGGAVPRRFRVDPDAAPPAYPRATVGRNPVGLFAALEGDARDKRKDVPNDAAGKGGAPSSPRTKKKTGSLSAMLARAAMPAPGSVADPVPAARASSPPARDNTAEVRDPAVALDPARLFMRRARHELGARGARGARPRASRLQGERRRRRRFARRDARAESRGRPERERAVRDVRGVGAGDAQARARRAPGRAARAEKGARKRIRRRARRKRKRERGPRSRDDGARPGPVSCVAQTRPELSVVVAFAGPTRVVAFAGRARGDSRGDRTSDRRRGGAPASPVRAVRQRVPQALRGEVRAPGVLRVLARAHRGPDRNRPRGARVAVRVPQLPPAGHQEAAHEGVLHVGTRRKRKEGVRVVDESVNKSRERNLKDFFILRKLKFPDEACAEKRGACFVRHSLCGAFFSPGGLSRRFVNVDFRPRAS